MPFDSNGKYSLPGGNPVIPGSTISSSWANNTLSDVGNALSQTMLRRAGSVAPLNLNNDIAGFLSKLGLDTLLQDLVNRVKGLEAESAASIGTIIMAGHANIARYSSTHLICDGRAVSRTDYADLFAAIGTTWGIGNGATTFNLPDWRAMVPRGQDMGKNIDPDRQFATFQQDQNRAHTHTGTTASSGAHVHTFSGTGSTASAGGHTHSVSGTAASNGAHNHTVSHLLSTFDGGSSGDSALSNVNRRGSITATSSSAGAHTHTVSGTAANSGAHTHTVTVTGDVASAGGHTHTITVGESGGTEARMRNVATVFLIKYRIGGDVQLLNALVNSNGDSLLNPIGDQLTGGVIL